MLATVCIFVILCIYFFYIRNSEENRAFRPPGPWGLPIVGHLLFLGREPHKKILEWKKTYGPIIYLQFGCQPTVVLTDGKMIKEIFKKQAAAERPRIKYLGEISHGYKGVVLSTVHKSLEQRNFILKNWKNGLGPSAMEIKTMEEVKTFMKELEDEVRSMNPPSQPILMNSRFTASVLNSFWSILMSRRFQRTDPEFASIVEEAHHAVASPGILGELAMFLPCWLATLVPGIFGLTRRKKAFHAVYDFAEREIQKRNETRIRNYPRDLTDVYLDKVESTTDPKSTFHKSQNFQPITTGDMFFGALDTTSTALEWLLIQLVRNPEVQNKLYEEVSRVTSRHPSLSQRARMPYTEAVVHELLRANTIVPLGIVHCAAENIMVEKYIIPTGTMIIANLWGVHHDPEVWDDPSCFRPERFLEKRDGELRIKKNVANFLPFSHGHRTCPGKTQAMDSLFLFIASLVQKFEFECSDELMPTLDMTHGLVAKPKKFQVNVRIRQE